MGNSLTSKSLHATCTFGPGTIWQDLTHHLLSSSMKIYTTLLDVVRSLRPSLTNTTSSRPSITTPQHTKHVTHPTQSHSHSHPHFQTHNDTSTIVGDPLRQINTLKASLGTSWPNRSTPFHPPLQPIPLRPTPSYPARHQAPKRQPCTLNDLAKGLHPRPMRRAYYRAQRERDGELIDAQVGSFDTCVGNMTQALQRSIRI
jgi:hypothetical protein